MKTLASIVITLAMTLSLHAQKFGYVNTAALLEQMPEVQTADKQLSAFREGLVKGGETKVNSFKENYQKYLDDVNNGVLSQIQQNERENSLAQEQQAINDYDQQVQQQVLDKRQELLKPILQKIDEAVQAIGKEGGYTFIFDSSVSGALLYAVEGDDLMNQVKAKLGIQ